MKATIASKRQGGTLARIGVATGPVAIDARILPKAEVPGPGVLLVEPDTFNRRFIESPGGDVLAWAQSPDGRTVVVMGPEGAVIDGFAGHRWSIDRRWDLESFAPSPHRGRRRRGGRDRVFRAPIRGGGADDLPRLDSSASRWGGFP